MNDNNMVCCG